VYNDYGTIHLNCTNYMFLDKTGTLIGDQEGNVYRIDYDDSGKFMRKVPLTSEDVKNHMSEGENCLSGHNISDLPENFLKNLKIDYVLFLGVSVNTGYSFICSDPYEEIEGLIDEYGRILWEDSDFSQMISKNKTY